MVRIKPVSIEHYENFPVASVLCPPALRPAVTAIYHFARTADDIADEGEASAESRLADLAAYRADLVAVCEGRLASTRWSGVFTPLASRIGQYQLPPQLLHDLLDAFAQDSGNPIYPDRASLLDYCRRSANPVGRLLLHLYGMADATSLRQSDAICSALQLINFWQDISIDGPRHRHYVPLEDLRALVRELCAWAQGLMCEGAPLALRVPGRAGWELRLVVQGGLRILEKISQMEYAVLSHRPALKPFDVAVMAWRALRMSASAPAASTGAAAR
jgi:phytoene/squalene synthetase